METWKDEVLEQSFVNTDLIEKLISAENIPSDEEFNKVMEKAEKGKDTLSLEEVAVLLNSPQKERIERIFETAKEIKLVMPLVGGKQKTFAFKSNTPIDESKIK